jgi:hypothetical protein
MRIRLVPAAVATLLAALLAGCGDDQSGTQADFTRPGDVPVSVLLSPDGEDWREVDLPPEQFANVVLSGVEGGRGGFCLSMATTNRRTSSRHGTPRMGPTGPASSCRGGQ